MRHLTVLALLGTIPAAGESRLSPLPIHFEENRGQFEPGVRFAARSFSGSVLLDASGSTLAIDDKVVRMRLVGARPDATLRGVDPQPGSASYFVGRDPAHWKTGVPLYGRVDGGEVYPGIRLVYYANQGQLEHDFIVAPGADPAQIRLRFEGARKIELERSGDVVLHAGSGAVRYRKPFVYQDHSGVKSEVKAHYVRRGREISFHLASYDKSKPLVIDPVIVWNRAITASMIDQLTGVGADAAGNIYVTGSTNSPDFPSVNALFPTVRGGVDAFILKLSPNGQQILYSTFLGGAGADLGRSIAVDEAGSATIVGSTTSTDLPMQQAAQATYGGGTADAFVAKLDPTGSRLIFSTYLGGSGQDLAAAVGLDSLGNIGITGFTASVNFRTTPGVVQAAFGGAFDAFAAKLSATGQLIFSTFLGGSSTDNANAIAVHPGGEILLGGATASRNFPLTAGAYQSAYGGGTFDGFVARLNASGTALIYSSYLGGSGDDIIQALTLDPANMLWAGGRTTSSNLPVTPNATNRTFPGMPFSSFVARLRAQGPAPAAPGFDAHSALAEVVERQGQDTTQWVSYDRIGALLSFANVGDLLDLLVAAGISVPNDDTCPRNTAVMVLLNADGSRRAAPFCLNGEANGAARVRSGRVVFGGNIIETANGRSTVDMSLTKVREITPLVPQQHNNSLPAGDPIDPATGDVYGEQEIFDMGGPFPLRLAAGYSSVQPRGNVSALGRNRMHTFEAALVRFGKQASVLLYPGRVFNFAESSPGTWQITGSEQRPHQLVAIPGGFQFAELGPNLIYTFNAAGALLRVEDRNGNTHTVTQGPNGPTLVSDGRGREIRFSYSGPLLSRVDATGGGAVTFGFAGADLTSLTDHTGRRIVYEYAVTPASRGLLAAETRPAGNRPFTQRYDSAGRAIEQADARGNRLRLEYGTPTPASTIVTDARGVAFEHSFAGQNLAGLRDPDGKVIAVTYDSNNRRTSVVDRTEGRTAFTYDAAGNLTSYADPEGNTTRLTWVPQTQGPFVFFNLARVDYPDSVQEHIVHDARGNAVTLVDRANHTWRATYNAAGQLATITNPAGGVTTYTYDEAGGSESIRFPSGDLYRFSADSTTRTAQLLNPDNTRRTVRFDASGRVDRRTDERDKPIILSYDANDNITSVTDPAGQPERISYDADDRVAAIADREGKSTSFSYDAAGNPSAMTNAAGDVSTLHYDNQNRLARVGNCRDEGPRMAHDAEGRVRALADGAGRTLQFQRNKNGQVTRLSTPLGRNVDFVYDPMRRLRRTANALGEATTFRYDPRGYLAGVTLPGEWNAAYTRNEFGLLTSVTDANGSVTAYEYDASGRRIARIDPLGRRTALTYAMRNRPAATEFPDSIGSVTYSYDAVGNVTRRVYSDGTEFNLVFDDNGRLTSGEGFEARYNARGDMTFSNGLLITSDDAGRIGSITYGEGKSVTYAYDCRGLLTSVTDWAGGRITFEYNAAGQVTVIGRPNGVSTSYEYDEDGRLRRITEGEVASIALTRDLAGRLSSAERNLPRQPALQAASLENGYDAAHQLTAGTHDSNGRRTSDTTRAYVWDLADRLRSVQAGESVTTYSYDALRQRIARARGGTTREYVLNYALGLPSVAIERQAGADLRYHVYLPNGLLLYTIAADGARRFPHFDETGSTAFVTNDAGAVAASYGITPYGEVVSREGDLDNPFTWQGAYGVMDEGGGLYYVRFRYYDANSARFLSRDPIEAFDGNPYRYALSSPTRFNDALGLSPRDLTANLTTPATAQAYGLPTTSPGDSNSFFSFRNLLASGFPFGPRFPVNSTGLPATARAYSIQYPGTYPGDTNHFLLPNSPASNFQVANAARWTQLGSTQGGTTGFRYGCPTQPGVGVNRVLSFIPHCRDDYDAGGGRSGTADVFHLGGEWWSLEQPVGDFTGIRSDLSQP